MAQTHRFLSAGCLSHHFHILKRLKKEGDSMADHGVIIYQHNTNGGCACHSAFLTINNAIQLVKQVAPITNSHGSEREISADP
jgi:hypothetical protein